MTGHTPTPWVVDDLMIFEASKRGWKIANLCGWDSHQSKIEMTANAAFIVTACNAHDQLIAALERLVADYQDVPDATDADGQAVFEQARAALRAASGEDQ